MSLPLFIISSIIIVLLGYLVFRIIVRTEYLKRKRLSWIGWGSEFVIFALHFNFCYSFLNAGWPGWPRMPENNYQLIIGIGLFSIGLLLTILSMGFLGFKKAFGVNTDGLRNTGVYRSSRNPQLVFYTMVVFGVAVLWLSWYSVIWAVIYLYIAHIMVKTEEEHLSDVYGESYKQYCSEVPRYLIYK